MSDPTSKTTEPAAEDWRALSIEQGKIIVRFGTALRAIAGSSEDKSDPDLSSEVSWGNYDDCFSDGCRQARFDAAATARKALADDE